MSAPSERAARLVTQDRRDFDAAAGVLSRAEREWRQAALERFHPAHAWIERLG